MKFPARAYVSAQFAPWPAGPAEAWLADRGVAPMMFYYEGTCNRLPVFWTDDGAARDPADWSREADHRGDPSVHYVAGLLAGRAGLPVMTNFEAAPYTADPITAHQTAIQAAVVRAIRAASGTPTGAYFWPDPKPDPAWTETRQADFVAAADYAACCLYTLAEDVADARAGRPGAWDARLAGWAALYADKLPPGFPVLAVVSPGYQIWRGPADPDAALHDTPTPPDDFRRKLRAIRAAGFVPVAWLPTVTDLEAFGPLLRAFVEETMADEPTPTPTDPPAPTDPAPPAEAALAAFAATTDTVLADLDAGRRAVAERRARAAALRDGYAKEVGRLAAAEAAAPPDPAPAG